jgi:cytochrome c peroxidase
MTLMVRTSLLCIVSTLTLSGGTSWAQLQGNAGAPRAHDLSGTLAAEAERLLAERPARDLEKGGPPDPEALNALIALGEDLFLNETFDGNGRTCGTCHLPSDQLGLTPATIAALPPGDPLFIAENDPALADLEHPPLMRSARALILENIDGFANPPVFRASPHLLNAALTAPYGLSGEFPDLRVFATGAVMQHFPKTMSRVSGVDFRLPTDAELDAMEAFMRSIFLPADQKFALDNFVTTLQQRRGSDLFFGQSKCGQCHNGTVLASASAALGGGNQNFNTGVVNLPINLVNDPDNPGGGPLPREAGGLREFNTPPLMGVSLTAPFFHDTSAQTLEEAVEFYDRPEFNSSPAAGVVGPISFTSVAQVNDVVAFLESLTELSFEFDPRAAVFGPQDVDVGQAGPITVTLTDVGGGLVVDSVDVVGPHSGDFLTAIVSPTEVEVLFDPSAVGPRSANLEFSTNAGDVGVRLRGVGIETGVPPFADVAPADPAAPFVEALFLAGATAGCGGGNFCPDALVTRAQLAVMLVIAMGEPEMPPRGEFSDVGPTAFAAGFIERLLAEGITAGCGGGKFCPNASVTRAQLAVLAVLASGRTPVNPPLGLFSDVAPGSFAAGFIERLLLDGVVVGCGGGKFCPGNLVTRKQAAVILSGAFDLP